MGTFKGKGAGAKPAKKGGVPLPYNMAKANKPAMPSQKPKAAPVETVHSDRGTFKIK